MPTSHYGQLNQIMEAVVQLRPKKVLDIGIGFGKYGFLCREYLEIWGEGDDYTKWERKIDGIEIFENYIQESHRIIYNDIFVGNAVDVLPTLDQQYDLILLIDVLEHFSKADGEKVLDYCSKLAKNVIVSTPWDIGDQGGGYGNVYETHLSQWTKKDFKRFSEHDFIYNHQSLIALIGPHSKAICKGIKRRGWKIAMKEVLHRLFGFTVFKREVGSK